MDVMKQNAPLRMMCLADVVKQSQQCTETESAAQKLVLSMERNVADCLYIVPH